MQSWSSLNTPLEGSSLSSLICLPIVLFIPFIHHQSDQFIIKVHVGCGAGIITWCTFSPGALSLYELKESGINALMRLVQLIQSNDYTCRLQNVLNNCFINPGEYYLPLQKDKTTLLKLHPQLTYKQNEKQYYKHTLQFSLVVLSFYKQVCYLKTSSTSQQ